MSLASDRPEFTPPSTSGRGRAIGLAVLAHAFLIAALTWGVSWKREANNAPVQAELWSTTVQQAAPALVEPAVVPPPPQPQPKPEVKPEPPPPPIAKPAKVVEPEPEPKIDPQIAIEKAKKEEKKKLEKKKSDAEAKALAKQEAAEEAAEEAKQEALDKKKRLLDAKKLEEKKVTDAKKANDAKAAANDAKYEASLKTAREAQLKRIAGQAGASGAASATGEAKQSTGPSAGYGSRVAARILPNIVFPGDTSSNPNSEIEIKCALDGTILSRRLVKSSGNRAWDEAALRAVDKTEILPKDTDGRVPSSLIVSIHP